MEIPVLASATLSCDPLSTFPDLSELQLQLLHIKEQLSPPWKRAGRIKWNTDPLPRWCSGKESAWGAGGSSSTPGSGRSPGEGNGNPLQYSSLGSPMDRGAWRAIVLGSRKKKKKKKIGHDLSTKQLYIKHTLESAFELFVFFFFFLFVISSPSHAHSTLQTHCLLLCARTSFPRFPCSEASSGGRP